MKKFLVAATACMTLLTCTPATHAEEYTRYNYDKFHQTMDDLLKEKPNGVKVYGTSAEGQTLSSIDYKDEWFGMKNVKTQYMFNDKKITSQITLVFDNVKSPTQIIANMKKSLGKPYIEGKSPAGSPSQYYVQWTKDQTNYNLQFFGDYIDVYITEARYYKENGSFKLPETTYVIDKQRADVSGDGIADEVTVVGKRFDEHAMFIDDLYLLTYNPKSKVSTQTKIDGGIMPALKINDLTTHRGQEVLIEVPTGGTGGFVDYYMYSLTNDKVKKINLPKMLSYKGKLLDNYRFTVTIDGKTLSYAIPQYYRDVYNSFQYFDKKGKVKGTVALTEADYAWNYAEVNKDKKGTHLVLYTYIRGPLYKDALLEVKATYTWNKTTWKRDSQVYKLLN